MTIVLDTIKSNETRAVNGPLTVKGNIGSSATVSSIGLCSVVGNIGSIARVTAQDGDVKVGGNIGSSATVRSDASCSVGGNIGANTTITARNGDITVGGNIGPSAIVTARNGDITVDGNIGSSAIVTVHNGNITVRNISANAQITINGSGSLTVDGNISSGTRITLNGGLLHIKGSISPTCTITGAANLSDYATAGNDNSSMTASNGTVIFSNCKGSSVRSGSGVNTTTITDPITRNQIEIRQDTSSGEITVNGRKMPFSDKHQLRTGQIDGKLIVNGHKVEIDGQELRVDGQLVVDGAVVQPIPKRSNSPVGSNTSHFSAGGPTFLAAPASFQAVQQQKTNEKEPLLNDKDADEQGCCCAVM